jgi:hypothetical protein
MNRRAGSRGLRWLRFIAGVYLAPAGIVGLLLLIVFGLGVLSILLTLLMALVGA